MTGVRAARPVLLAAAALAFGTPAEAAGLDDLAPVLVHDSRERFRATSVRDADPAVPGRAREGRAPVVYGRPVDGRETTLAAATIVTPAVLRP